MSACYNRHVEKKERTMEIAFTGPRQLTKAEKKKIYQYLLSEISHQQGNWHVGDAPGLDNFIKRAANYFNKNLTLYEVEGTQKWHFAERSQRMINAIAPNGTLYAFPNKHCPEKCSPKNPFNGHGSGTWGTIAYAKKKQLKIQIFPLFTLEKYLDTSWYPDWIKEPEQLKLF